MKSQGSNRQGPTGKRSTRGGGGGDRSARTNYPSVNGIETLPYARVTYSARGLQAGLNEDETELARHKVHVKGEPMSMKHTPRNTRRCDRTLCEIDTRQDTRNQGEVFRLEGERKTARIASGSANPTAVDYIFRTFQVFLDSQFASYSHRARKRYVKFFRVKKSLTKKKSL